MRTLLLLFFCLAFIGSYCQTFPLKDSGIEFKDHIGIKPGDSSKMYCLIGSELLTVKNSSNAKELVSKWIKAHPDAEFITVATVDFIGGIKVIYCWLKSGDETINEYLVENGAYYGKVMEFQTSNGKRTYDVVIDEATYEAFIKRVKKAEEKAKKKKLGLWKK